MLSVIITAYDHHQITKIHVRECMNSLIMPDEIIVVNDGGTPDLKDKLKELDKKTKIIYAEVLPPKIPWNYNGACNLGVYLSRGDFLAIEDNDNIPQKDFYGQCLKIFNDFPNVGRVISRVRNEVSSSDIEKPVSEWIVRGTRGPNQGTSMIRREVYLKVKGQDEEFCGQYGWMYYEWKRRLLRITEFSSCGSYYYVLEGQSNLDRHNSQKNYHLLHHSTLEKRIQPPKGILNFTYKYEVL